MSITISMRAPTPDTFGVSRETPITLSFVAPGESFTDVSIDVNGQRAYANGVFTNPAFQGTFRLQSGLLIVTLVSRRWFDPDTTVYVEAHATSDITAVTSYSAEFHAVNSSGSLRDVSLRVTAVDSPLDSSLMSIDLFRRAMLGAFGRGNGSFLSLLVHRVKQSQIVALLPKQPRSVDDTISRLLASEVAPISELNRVVSDLSFAWPGVEAELGALGYDEQTVRAISRSFNAEYPQERVGAAALVVLLAVR